MESKSKDKHSSQLHWPLPREFLKTLLKVVLWPAFNTRNVMSLLWVKDFQVPKPKIKNILKEILNSSIWLDQYKEIVSLNSLLSMIKSVRKFFGIQVPICSVKAWKTSMEHGYAMDLHSNQDFSMIHSLEIKRYLKQTMKKLKNRLKSILVKNNNTKEFF